MQGILHCWLKGVVTEHPYSVTQLYKMICSIGLKKFMLCICFSTESESDIFDRIGLYSLGLQPVLDINESFSDTYLGLLLIVHNFGV